MISRRATMKAFLLAATIVAGAAGFGTEALAADKVLKIGIDLSFTGSDAENAARMANGAILAFDDANAKKEVPGYTFQLVKYDDATPTAGQYDPAQAATNARSMISDKATVAAIGPQMSGAGKAMAPILSQGDMAIITPSSTNPDITDPKFAAQYRPAGKPIYFRTVATDAYQGPNMANYMAETLKMKTVYVLDDTGAYGVGLADAFQAQAEKKGVKILGRDKLDPKAVDYSSILTKIKALNPDAIYYGGVTQAGVKLAKQAYDIIPKVIKGGGDGMESADLLKGAGFPAVEGWYVTVASPHFEESTNAKAKAFADAFYKKFNQHPDDYSVTTYVAAAVIVDAVKDLVKAKKTIDRSTMRDAIQHADLKTSLIGQVDFDANGDLKNKTISVFKITKDDKNPLDDPTAQYKYIGTAPTN